MLKLSDVHTNSCVLELSNIKSMENLEKLEQLIGKIPARNWEFYAKKLGWSRGKVYDYFGTLQNQNKAYSKDRLWFPKTVNPETPKKQLGFFERRAERKKLEKEERQLESCDNCDWLAKSFPSMEPLKEFSNGTRKRIAKSRKSP